MRVAGDFCLSVGLLLALNLPAAAITITQVQGKFECPNQDNQQACAILFEERFLKEHPGLVSRDGDRLKIRLQNKRYAFIADAAKYMNVLELERMGRFLAIREQFYEGNTWHILDMRNGKRTDIAGYPLFSPDGNTFVAASEDLDAMWSDTVLDVYQITESGIRRTFRGISAKNPTWAARNVFWESNDRIRFSRATLSQKSPSGYAETPASLSRQGKGWVIQKGNVSP